MPYRRARLPKTKPTRDGCDFCNPRPHTIPAAAPDLACPACAVREWAIFPSAVLNAAEWAHLRGLLDLRAGGRCESCAQPFIPGQREPNAHHRRGLKMGGTSDPTINGLANLLLLCVRGPARLGGSAPGCHSSINSDSTRDRARGLVVEQGSYLPGSPTAPPEVSTPLVLHSGRPVLLDPLAGSYIPVVGAVFA